MAQRPSRTAGFTLIEMFAVCAIIGILVTFAIPKLHTLLTKARNARAIGDIVAIQTDLMALEAQGQPLPSTLAGIGRGNMRDPWGRPYQYLVFPPGPGVPAGARRDRFLVPVNSTFDLYSLGPDGASSPPFTAGPSHDDIVRANDGGFIGLASKY
ncbi:MAG TPA: prepilin-type N-terminal cleavage/methylation domain-containing protein [Gemmatimonadales bacterium]|nr:prepilin-type N-terminal cleavage/methylation domain-containing protein [Gemmatimonadales bacterium]